MQAPAGALPEVRQLAARRGAASPEVPQREARREAASPEVPQLEEPREGASPAGLQGAGTRRVEPHAASPGRAVAAEALRLHHHPEASEDPAGAAAEYPVRQAQGPDAPRAVAALPKARPLRAHEPAPAGALADARPASAVLHRLPKDAACPAPLAVAGLRAGMPVRRSARLERAAPVDERAPYLGVPRADERPAPRVPAYRTQAVAPPAARRRAPMYVVAALAAERPAAGQRASGVRRMAAARPAAEARAAAPRAAVPRVEPPSHRPGFRATASRRLTRAAVQASTAPTDEPPPALHRQTDARPRVPRTPRP